jgi:hypothetical protein
MPSWRVSRAKADGPVPVSGLGNSLNKVTLRMFHPNASPAWSWASASRPSCA